MMKVMFWIMSVVRRPWSVEDVGAGAPRRGSTPHPSLSPVEAERVPNRAPRCIALVRLVRRKWLISRVFET